MITAPQEEEGVNDEEKKGSAPASHKGSPALRVHRTNKPTTCNEPMANADLHSFSKVVVGSSMRKLDLKPNPSIDSSRT